MALGGYLYKGYSVEKSSSYSTKDWFLAVHKCRVKAFLDSCKRSHCGWKVSRSLGDIDLDQDNAGIIYSLSTNPGAADDSYRGYATYFKYQPNEATPPVVTF